jgi:drug/metabolite transporter (DMT)-like permease
MAYLYLIVAVLALGLLGVLHKVADFRRCRPQAITLFLFLGAATATWVACFWQYGVHPLSGMPWAVAPVGGVCGCLASLAILNFQQGVRHGRIAASWLIINLSTALPTVLSIVIYREHVGTRRAAGLLLALVALVILWLERRREEELGEPTSRPKGGVSTPVT